MRRLLTALACLALASCWYGDRLYTPSDARPAIRPGVYRSVVEGETDKTYRISTLANGMTQFDTGEKKDLMGIAPLDPAAGSFVAWLPLKDEDKPSATDRGELQIYMLMVRVSDVEYRMYPPECKDAAAEIARKSGAIIETGSSPACRFNSRADVEKALRLLPRDESSASTLTRIP
jgi:hypothetical protein